MAVDAVARHPFASGKPHAWQRLHPGEPRPMTTAATTTTTSSDDSDDHPARRHSSGGGGGGGGGRRGGGGGGGGGGNPGAFMGNVMGGFVGGMFHR